MVAPFPLRLMPLFFCSCYSDFRKSRELGQGGSFTIFFAMFHASLFLHLQMFITAMVVVDRLEFRRGFRGIFRALRLLVPRFLCSWLFVSLLFLPL